MMLFKRSMSVLLVLGLLVGMIPPTTVSAEEVEAPAETLQETQATETVAATEITEEITFTEESVAETEFREPTEEETTVSWTTEETEAAETEETEPEPLETEFAQTEPAETVPEETVAETEIGAEGQEELYSGSEAAGETITQAQFDKLLSDAAKTGQLTLNASVTLTKNITIPENVYLYMTWQGEIVVPDGKTLTVCGGGGLDGHLLVQPGGTLDVKVRPLWLYGAEVEIQGTYVHSNMGMLYRFADNGSFAGTVYGVDKKNMGSYIRMSDDSCWGESLKIFQDPDYILTNLGIQGNVTLPVDLSVGESRNICVEGNAGNCLTVGEGVTLTTGSQITVYESHALVNNGTIQTQLGSNLVVYGTLTNNGNIVNNWDMFVTGTLVNYGNIDLMATDTPDYYTLLQVEESGSLENHGSVHCYGSGTVKVLGSWEYNAPIYHSLPRPENVSWHKLVRNIDDTVYDAKGHIYWEVAEPEDGEYVIHIYNADTNEQVFRTNCQFGGFRISGRSQIAFLEADLPSGNYYFTVTSVSHSDEYEDSAPARSDVFSYTRPGSSIGAPRNVRWDGLDAVWTVPADGNDLTSYEIRWYYAPDADSEPVRRSSEFNVFNTQRSLPRGVVENCGAGYYSFSVRAIPSDATRQTIGAWVSSGQFYYDPDNFHYDETYLDRLHSPNPPGMEPDIDFKHLQQPVVLENNYTVEANVQLDIAGGGSITVPEGKILILNNPTSVYNGGKLIVEEGGKLIVRRDLWVGYDSIIDIRGAVEFQDNAMAWFRYGQSFSMNGVPAENVMVEVLFDAGCTMVENMLSFFESSRWGWTILRIEGDMTLPRSVTSPARSNIYIPGYSSLTVPQGMTLSIPQDAQMNVDGTLYNYGTVQGLYTGINPEAVIHVTENGCVYNDGRVIANQGTVVDIQGSWEGNDPERNGGIVNRPMSFREFKAQVDAMKSGGYLDMRHSVVLEGSLTVPKNVGLLLNGGTIVVPKGKVLTLNGAAELNSGSRVIVEAGGKLVINEQLWVNNNSKLINNGTVALGKNSYGEKARIYFCYDQGNEISGVSHGDQTLVMAVDNFEFPGWKNYKALFESSDYAGTELQIWGYQKAVLEEDLTVPANGTLVINPSWSDINNGTRNDWVVINSNVTVYGTMWINARYNGTPCNLEINGNVDVMPGGVLNVSGNVRNNGNVRVAVGAHYHDYKEQFGAVWEGNYPEIELSEQDLRDQIASGATSLTLNNDIVLKKSLTIPQGVTLNIYGNGSLTVPAGVTLTLNERVAVWGGRLTVEPRGVLKQNAYFIDVYDGATVDIRGSVQFREAWSFVRHNDNGSWAPSSVSGVPAAHQALSVQLGADNGAYWSTAADVVENNTFTNVFVLITDGRVTLPRSMTIPANTLLHVDNRNTTLEIPEGCTLTNHGEIYVWNRNALENYGTIENHRGFYVYGKLYNYGDIQLKESRQENESLFQVFPGGYLQNQGNVSVNSDSYLLAVGSWEGNDPVANGGSITMGRYAAVPNKAEVLAGKSLTLKVFDYAEYRDLTDKQVTWSLDEKYAAYATLTAKGKLTAQKVMTRMTVEAVATVHETGETVTATIDLIPAVSYVAVLDGETVINGKTVTVDIAEESRAFQVELYPLALNTEELKDNWCTWTISDKNGTYASYRIEDGILTVSPTGKAGTVTVKVSCNAGVKKEASFKLQFAAFAKGIDIFNTEAELTGGQKLTLLAAVTPRYATQAEVVWSLKDPADKAYATVSGNVLTAKNVDDSREVVLVATSKDGKVSKEYAITILPKNRDILTLKLDGKSVTKGTVYADLNTTTAIELKAYLFGQTEEAPDVKWSSSSAKVAIVTDGTVHLMGAGTATITATCGSRKTTVTVKAAQLAKGVTVSGPGEVASGKTVQLKATVEGAASQKVTWSILQGEQWGKINSSGKFTAAKDMISAQTVTVAATAADGSGVISEPFTLTIRPLAQGIQIYTKQSGQVVSRAESDDRWWARSNTTFQWDLSTQDPVLVLGATVYPFYEENGKFNAIQDVTWKSSSAKIADIVNGQLVIYGTGNVTITATAADGSGQKASFKLKVIRTVTELTIADQTVQGGKSLNLAKLVTINPTDATNKKLTWTITGGSEYATVSSSGSFKAKKVTSEKTVEVTVSSQDGGASTIFYVTITP